MSDEPTVMPRDGHATDDVWFDEAAGPVVRPYAMTSGRTQPSNDGFDLIALIVAARSIAHSDVGLTPEHITIVRLCRLPISVARSEEHTSELQSQSNLVCRLLLEKKN